jgi:hypothetical protein
MDLACHVVAADDSYGPQIDRSLAMTPAERLEHSARTARQFKEMRERAIARR